MMKRLKKILFFADGARGQLAALRRAYGLAIHHGAELVVMGVVEEVSTDDRRLQHNINRIQKTMIRDRSLELDRLIADIGESHRSKLAVAKLVQSGKDYVEVINAVKQGKFDMVVKSVNQQNAFREAIFGSTDLRLMHLLPCPVMILKPLRRKSWHSILVAVDPRAESPEAVGLNMSLLDMGAAIAEIEQADLHALHVLERPLLEKKFIDKDEMKQLETALRTDTERKLANLMEDYSHLKFNEHLLKGKPHSVIATFVSDNEIDLLVMGSVARSGIPGLIVGNTAEKIMDSVDCSILVMKPKGWKTPSA